MHSIVLDGVSFHYRDAFGRRANEGIVGVNLSLEQGKVTCLLGANGSGKSTIIKLVLGFAYPTDGRIFKPRNMRFSYIGDGGRSLYSYMNLDENVRYSYALRGIALRNGHDEELERLSRLFGLIDGGMKVSAMSRGMRQKAAIICALLLPHDFLIADEPTLGLDGPSQMEFESILRCEVGLGRGVCLSTNDMPMARRISDRMMFIERGRLIER
ncbi:MAG: putative ABC transporter ATP-binding protein YbhF [Firmicutes bacterium ADurb.Bin153]|nr:MAG: putative ABC transporter ATP-binding protein YbhF [Firmicutes bacterium ADurb.Bin153]